MSDDWLYYALGLITYPVLALLAIGLNRVIINHRKRQFLRLVHIGFKDHSEITLIAREASDKRAMDRLERQVREEYDFNVEPPPPPLWPGDTGH